MNAPLTQLKQTWRSVGEQIVAAGNVMLKNMAPLMVAHYTLPDLKGRFIHSHKGRSRRQHKLPQHRRMWQGMADAQRKAGEGNRGTSNAELAVA